MRPISRCVRSLALFVGSPLALATAAVCQTDPLLEVHSASLTAYKYASATPINDVRPLAVLRGVSLDGTLRAGSTQGMAIAGNPFGSPWSGGSGGGIRLGSGTHQIQDVDLALPAQVPWVIGRSYCAHQESASPSHRDSNGIIQGRNWFQSSQPEIVFYDDNDNAKDLIYLVYGADRYLEFKRFNSGSGSFRATNGGAGVMVFAAGASTEPDTYALTCMDGTVVTFFGFDGDSGVAAGQIWKIADAAGNVAFVGDATTGSTAISSGYDGSGRIIKAYDSADRRLTYTYGSVGGSTRLTEVKSETKSSGTWASPSGVTERGKVEYAYYTADGDSYGDQLDLKLVSVTTPLTDSGVSHTKKKHYRYWEGTFNSSTNPGHPHGLKLVVDFEGCRNYDWAQDGSLDDDFLTASTDSLKPYASSYWEYDSAHRIVKSWSNGECGCSGGTNGEYTFEYESNGSYTDNSGYDTAWMSRTIVHQPDGSYLTQYFDEVHQPLSKVITDADPDNTGPDPSEWPTYVVRDSAGMVTDISTPANVTAYTHSSASFTTSSSVGLVTSFVRESSGATKYYLLDRKWKAGTSGTAYLDGSWTYSTGSKATGDTYVIRPVLASEREYTIAVTSGTSGSNVTSYSTTFYSSSLAIQEVETTLPAVSTGTNGSNSSNTTKRHWTQSGNLDFEKSPDGHIHYRAYTNGQVVKDIEDTDTGETGAGEDLDGVSIPSGFATSGSPLHWKVTSTYDAQGRREMTTSPGSRNKKVYFSKLADGRLVTLAYNDFEVTPKFYGPVHYTVSNLAGKAEVSATVSLASNESTTALTGHIDETDADPITACDLGTVAQLTTNLYSEAGTQLETTRLYHVVPGSGAGSDGTNYDATSFGYDPMGRKWRSKAPHGTITRTVFDARGQVSEHWIGTNDSSFTGGESSGVDNMVKTDATVYDGGSAGGNGWVTQRTAFVEGSSTGQRVTSYSNDVRGNLLLETPAEAPYSFHKYDNLRRRVATGLFSSTASISVGSDDPTTETTNRLALSQTFYDELGRVWKSQRHKIDAADGSDDDNLQTLTWRDAEGHVTKVDGEQLTKTEYDRLGRTIRSWTLAEDNDSVYGDADDVSGDIVLEERQSVYDTTNGDLLMSATILRHPTDKGVGETTGSLDTGADGDRLKITIGDLKGRAQITDYWYDRFGRQTDVANLGSNNDATYDRSPDSTPLTRSSTVLRTTTTYAYDGPVEQIEDERAIKTRFFYDAAGRKTKEVRHYDFSVNSGAPTDPDDNQTVAYAYTDGLLVTLTADLPSSDQVTTYTYGTTKGASAGDSKIATGHLLYKVAYPDSTGDTDTVKHAYNAQGQEIWKKDQGGNIIETTYSDTGRATHKRVTTLGSGFDGTVRRISTTFDSLGRQQLVTQYDNATVGSGSVVDEVKFSYESWGNVEKFEQDRNSAVGGGSDDYEVSYAYEKATSGRNTIRRTTETLPSGNAITLYYNGGDDHDDVASRVTQVKDGSLRLASYWYLGASQVVGTKYAENNVMRHQWAAGAGVTSTYPDLDRFGRVIHDRWTKDLATDKDFYSVDRTWDRASNITLAEDNVHTGFDVSYTIDNINRLTRAQEGTWSGSITSEKRDQEWTLTHTGNWSREKLDLNGDGDWSDSNEHDDSRTHNDVNELTARDTDSNSSNNFTLSYDAAGNLTDDGESYTYEWDAFYRLRKVKNRSNAALVAEYTYNGLGFRLGEHADTDTDGDVDSNDKWYYSAYDERWRWVATFRESDSSPKEEFVPHQAGFSGFGGSSYIDLVILRDKDANTAWTSASDGVLEQRHYYCQNWHADVSALVTAGGLLQEWDKYLSYGTPFGLPGGDTDSDGDCDATDVTQIQTWITGSAYDVRGDIDLDGDVDATDKSTVQGGYQGATAGYSNPSLAGNRHMSAGSTRAGLGGIFMHRHRVLDTVSGRWLSRDSGMTPADTNFYLPVADRPLTHVDPLGLYSVLPGYPSGGGSPGGPPLVGDTGTSLPTEPLEPPGNPTAGCCAAYKRQLNTPPKPGWAGHTGCCGNKAVACVWNVGMAGTPPTAGGVAGGMLLMQCTEKHEEEHKKCCDCEAYASDGAMHDCGHSGQSSAAKQACCKNADDAGQKCLVGLDPTVQPSPLAQCDLIFPNDPAAAADCKALINEWISSYPSHGPNGSKCQ